MTPAQYPTSLSLLVYLTFPLNHEFFGTLLQFYVLSSFIFMGRYFSRISKAVGEQKNKRRKIKENSEHVIKKRKDEEKLPFFVFCQETPPSYNYEISGLSLNLQLSCLRFTNSFLHKSSTKMSRGH